MDDMDPKDETESSDQSSDGNPEESDEVFKRPLPVREDPKRPHHAGTSSSKNQTQDPKEKADEEDKPPVADAASNPVKLSKRQKKRMRDKRKKEETRCGHTRPTANRALSVEQGCASTARNCEETSRSRDVAAADGSRRAYSERNMTNGQDCRRVGCGVALEAAVPHVPRALISFNAKARRRSNSRERPSRRSLRIERFQEAYDRLLALVTTLPRDKKAVEEALHEYNGCRKCLKIACCGFMKAFSKFIKNMTYAHANMRPKQSGAKFLRKLYGQLTLVIDLDTSEEVSNAAIAVFHDLRNLVIVLSSRILQDMYETFDRVQLRLLHRDWMEKQILVCKGSTLEEAARRTVALVHNFVRSVCPKLTCVGEDERFLAVHRTMERAFSHDGSYWHNDYRLFLELYLNCDVLGAARRWRFIKAHPLVADCTADLQHVQYYGSVLEFWENFQRFKRDQRDNLEGF